LVSLQVQQFKGSIAAPSGEIESCKNQLSASIEFRLFGVISAPLG
jgi:hypothetical protein